MDRWSQGWDPVRKLWSVSWVRAQLGDFAGYPMALFCRRSFLSVLLNLVWKAVISPFFLGTLRSVKAVTHGGFHCPFLPSWPLSHRVGGAGRQSTAARFFPAQVD